MKKIKVVFITLAVITLSFITESYLYTKEKVYELGKNMGGYNLMVNEIDINNSDLNLSDELNLGTLLSSNFSGLEELIIRDDNYNIKSNKWRDLIASNPILAYTAFDLYSSSFIEGYKSYFEEAKKYSNRTDAEQSRINALNSSSALKSNVNSMKKYDKLIGDLLKLDDATLTRYIDSAQYEAQDGGFRVFPGDLIALTSRVSSNYPKWTNRKFLLEAQKFSLHVQKNLKY